MDKEQIMIYMPKIGFFMHISLGDGTNLHQEDIDKGYTDYLYISIYKYEHDRGLVEYTGGDLVLEKPFEEKYKCMADTIPDCMKFICGTIHEFVIIASNPYPDEDDWDLVK